MGKLRKTHSLIHYSVKSAIEYFRDLEGSQAISLETIPADFKKKMQYGFLVLE